VTKILDLGDIWIENILITIPITDAAGLHTNSGGDRDLEKPGHLVGICACYTNLTAGDNIENLGGLEILGQGFVNLTYGSVVNALRAGVQKSAGTSGNANVIISVMVFIKK